MPGGLKSASGHNLFTEQQEEWLGEVMEKEIRGNFNVVEDADHYLQRVADRLQAQLPPSSTHYRFVIIDSPELNSFGLVGGRIFIHRRMIAFVQNEDELAALLGHEMGHMVDHHVVLRFSDFFRQMGVTSLGDRADVLRHWKDFEDNARKIKHMYDEQREAEEQVIADRIAFYALVRAGYDPEKGIAFFDRLFQTKGKPGNFWSEFFGTTNPNGKRLREMLKTERPLAQNCIATRPAEAGEFAAWQKTIIASTKYATLSKADLPGLIRKVTLQSQLRSDLFGIEFSPDGKYLLAQDQSSIFVASREPLANLFRIDAFDAHTARFSPDSRSVVFYDKELRVEKWDVASGKRASIYQVTIPECFQSELSPNGDYLGCIDDGFGLKLVDVATNTVLLERKKFYIFTRYLDWYRYYLARLSGEKIRIFDMKFSPDDRYFIAGHSDSFVAYDLKERTEAKLSWRIHELGKISFTFVGPDEFDGLQYAGGNDMRLVRLKFPSGEKLDDFKVQAEGWLSSTENRDALLMRPAAAYPVGIVDLKTRKITQAFKNPAFAVYGEIYAGEQNSGEVALLSTADNKLSGRLKLPESLVGSARTSVFSADGKWLAVSQGSRGCLWSLENGQRLFLARGFNGALFENDQLITEFAKDPPNPSRVFQFDLHEGSNKRLFDVPDGAFVHARSWQWDNFLVTMHPENEKDELGTGHTILQVHDVHNNNVLWERRLHQGLPGLFYTPTAITMLIWDWGGIKEAAREDESISATLAGLENKDTSYLLQAFEPATGKLLGSVLVDTGKLSFRVNAGYAAGDKMFVTDSSNHRTLIYSIKEGARKGSWIGHPVAVTTNGDRVLVQNESGIADLYDTATLQSLVHFSFPARIVYADFARDGSLYVLTADQNVYQLSVNKEQQRAAQ
ncbi:MAG TPA: M48 family metalloprotease [Verrucomicrobiae bacterium]|jgi:WD40 repeat protein|nr:M48 family metalloprotease [Verrucomicrobiae bacterium]